MRSATPERVLEAVDAFCEADPKVLAEVGEMLRDLRSGAAEAWMTGDAEGCVVLQSRPSCLWVYGLHSRGRGTLEAVCKAVRDRARQLGHSKIRGWSVREGWEGLLGAQQLPGAVYEVEV